MNIQLPNFDAPGEVIGGFFSLLIAVVFSPDGPIFGYNAWFTADGFHSGWTGLCFFKAAACLNCARDKLEKCKGGKRN